jgi:hypothetical protein
VSGKGALVVRRIRNSRLFITTVAIVLGVLSASSPALAATEYRQPNWFTWETSVLDVLIVPPNHGQIVNGRGALNGLDPNELNPYANSYLAATEKSVADWDSAIATYGATWLKSGLVTNVYVVGRDTIPNAALVDPEVVITTDEGKGPILGVTFSSRPCLISNSKFFVTSFSYADMYNTSAHEFGHCLGLDHTVGFPTDDGVISHDVIYATNQDSIGAVGTHLHCISNLNVKGVERTFGGLFGQPSGGTVSMATTSYQRMAC